MDNQIVTWLTPFLNNLYGTGVYYGNNYMSFKDIYGKCFIKTINACEVMENDLNSLMDKKHGVLIIDKFPKTLSEVKTVFKICEKNSKNYYGIILLNNPLKNISSALSYINLYIFIKVLWVYIIKAKIKYYWVYGDKFSKEIVFTSINFNRQEKKSLKTVIKTLLYKYVPILIFSQCIVIDKTNSEEKENDIFNDKIYNIYSVLCLRGRVLFFVKEKYNNRNKIYIIALDDKAKKGRKNEYDTILAAKNIIKFGANYLPNIKKINHEQNNAYIHHPFDGIAFSGVPENAENIYKNIVCIYLKIINATITMVPMDKFIQKTISLLLDALERYLICDKLFIDKIKNHIANDYVDIHAVPLHLYHGDFKLENIIIERETNRIVGFIDWEFAELQGYPLLDILYLWLNQRAIGNGTDIFREFYILLNKYLSHDEMPSFIKQYVTEINLNNKQIRLLFLCFIMHHYFVRLTLSDEDIKITREHILATVCKLKEI